MNTAMMPQSIALPQRPPGRHYCVQMTTIRRRRALLCCAGIALLAPAGAFHALTPSLKANNIRSSTCSSVLHDAVSVLNSTPASRTTAASCRTTTSRCQGAPKLSAAGGSGSDSLGEKPYYTPADLDAYSAPWGITLHYRGTLNTYRIEAHRPDGEVAGYTTGFYLGELLHLDKVQVCVCKVDSRPLMRCLPQILRCVKYKMQQFSSSTLDPLYCKPDSPSMCRHVAQRDRVTRRVSLLCVFQEGS